MGKIFPNSYYDSKHPEGEYNQPTSQYVYHHRNYYLFGKLADVRGEGPALKSVRGVPKDASKDYVAIVEKWEGDGHTHHWYTLEELLAHDWYNKTKYKGYVDLMNYVEYKKYGNPIHYGLLYPNTYNIISNAEMDALYKKIKKSPEIENKNVLTLIEWEESDADNCMHFMEAINYMKLLGDPDKVRMVFFFDN